MNNSINNMDINKINSTFNSVPLTNNLKSSTDQELMDVSQQFESIFLGQLFKEMKNISKPISGKDMLDGGMAEDIFKDMLYDQYALDAAKNNSIGLAQMVYDSLSSQRT